MNLSFQDPGLQYSIDHILPFQSEELSDYWRNALFLFYPQLDRMRFDALDGVGRISYLRTVLGGVYRENQALIAEKRVQYQAHWDEHRPQVEAAFSDAFALDVRPLFNDLRVNLTLNPICPRYLEECAFDIFYLNSHRGALGMALHEMTHFLWFYVWNRRFQDSYQEYESPSLKWVLSEMVVEPILRDERLASINPYWPNECVYDYFYPMTAAGTPILDTMNELYRSLPIHDFMEQGYAYCLRHEAEIRSQMK